MDLTHRLQTGKTFKRTAHQNIAYCTVSLFICAIGRLRTVIRPPQELFGRADSCVPIGRANRKLDPPDTRRDCMGDRNRNARMEISAIVVRVEAITLRAAT